MGKRKEKKNGDLFMGALSNQKESGFEFEMVEGGKGCNWKERERPF